MKTPFFLSIIMVLGLLSCEPEDKSYPMTPGEITVDSAARLESTTGTLTLSYLTGKVTNSGNLPVERGLYIGDSLSEVSGSTAEVVAMTADRTLADLDGGAGRFTQKVTLLKARTWYFYRFYVKNYIGTSMSPIDSFYSAPNLPGLTMAPAVVDGDTIRINGAMTRNGGESVSEKGFVYSLGQLPLVTDVDNVVKIVVPDTAIGPFSSTITGLLKNRKYYVRTYAKNRGGINHSGQQIFTTNP